MSGDTKSTCCQSSSALVCSTYEHFVVIFLSDADLTALKFLGPGEYLRPFASVSLAYRYDLDAAQGVIDLITSIRNVPQYFGCECLSPFVSRLYS